MNMQPERRPSEDEADEPLDHTVAAWQKRVGLKAETVHKWIARKKPPADQAARFSKPRVLRAVHARPPE